MNRRQKIIVSITGIFLVLLILVGLTYAYFLTRINGNDNEKSISVTTANLEVEYKDNNDIITGDKIIPGTTLPEKVFTVTNNGNGTVDYSVGLVNIINTLKYTEDMVYKLTCISYNKEGFTLSTNGSVTGTENGSCSGVNETEFPNLNSYVVTNSIEVGKVHVYKMIVEYKETNTDQSDDMNKELSAKIDIFDPKSLTIEGSVTNSSENDYVVIHSKEQESNIVDGNYRFIGIIPDTHTIIIKNRKTTDTKSASLNVEKGTPSVSGSKIIYNDDKNVANVDININNNIINLDVKKISDGTPTLEETILAKAKSGTGNRTIYQETPITSPGNSINESNERTLSKTIDDYGTTYYFRGNVIDNYINFAGMCWRIVRISGDGSIKLILEDQDNNCEKSDGNWDIPTTTGGSSKTGNFGYTEYAANTMTASDGTKNSSTKFIINYLKGITNNTSSMAYAFTNFQTGPLSNYLTYLKSGDWCLNDKAYATINDNTTPLTNQEILDNQIKGISFYYDSYVRLKGKTTKEPTLKCNGTNMSKFGDNNTDMYVGTLTADEIVYAGNKIGNSNENYYLINDYQKSNSLIFRTLSPNFFSNSNYDYAFVTYSDGDLNYYNYVQNSIPFRPSIQLKSNTGTNGGDGTKENPYTVKLS